MGQGKKVEWGDSTRWTILQLHPGRWGVFPPDRIYVGRFKIFKTFEEARISFIEQTKVP